VAVTNLLVRQLPIAFGVHTVILIFSFAIYTRLFTRAQLSKIFLSVFLASAFLVAAETIYSDPLLKLTGLTYEECFENPLLRAAFALPGELIILLLGSIFSLLTFYILAPVDSPAKPITSVEKRHKFKHLSVALTSLITLGQITLLITGNSPALVLAVSLGTWWQAFTLTGAGHRFASIVDNLF
jgi:hypothetical protein